MSGWFGRVYAFVCVCATSTPLSERSSANGPCAYAPPNDDSMSVGTHPREQKIYGAMRRR